jgi:ubiquinone/menaquinone biosynthesis C-methylase UbiE
VVKPGGRAVVLEFVRPPENFAGGAYRLYLRTLLPVIGGAISGQPAAYRYLSDTVDSYRTPDELRAMAGSAGWQNVKLKALAMGTVGIVSGARMP